MSDPFHGRHIACGHRGGERRQMFDHVVHEQAPHISKNMTRARMADCANINGNGGIEKRQGCRRLSHAP
jgi:hypothetical protein